MLILKITYIQDSFFVVIGAFIRFLFVKAEIVIKNLTSVNYETDGLNTCRVRSILKTHTTMTAWDAKNVNLFSDQEVTLVYERAKIACVLIQVDMKTIEIAYVSQRNVGM